MLQVCIGQSLCIPGFHCLPWEYVLVTLAPTFLTPILIPSGELMAVHFQ